jgi:hypothetical protein
MTGGQLLGMLIARDLAGRFDPRSNEAPSKDSVQIHVYWDASGREARSAVTANFDIVMQHRMEWIGVTGVTDSLALDPVFSGSTEETGIPRTLREEVATALEDSRWDFRTVRGIAGELAVSEDAVLHVLNDHPEIVRWVPATNTQGEQLLVDAARPVTRKERLLSLRAGLTKSYT